MNGQPPIQMGAQVDWGNPITDSLTFCCAPGIATWELVGGADGVPAGSLVRQERMLDTDVGVANWGYPMTGPALDFQCEYTLAAWFWMWPAYVPTANTWTNVITTNCQAGGVGGYQSGICVNRNTNGTGGVYFSPWTASNQYNAFCINNYAGFTGLCQQPVVVVGRCGQLRSGATDCYSNLPRFTWTTNAMGFAHQNNQSVLYVGNRSMSGDSSFECPVIIGAKWNRYLSNAEVQAVIDNPRQLLTSPSRSFALGGVPAKPHVLDGSPFGGSF